MRISAIWDPHLLPTVMFTRGDAGKYVYRSGTSQNFHQRRQRSPAKYREPFAHQQTGLATSAGAAATATSLFFQFCLSERECFSILFAFASIARRAFASFSCFRFQVRFCCLASASAYFAFASAARRSFVSAVPVGTALLAVTGGF